MRRTILFVLMINLLLLSGCGGGVKDEETVNIIQQELQSSQFLTAQALVCTGDSEYKLSCVSEGSECTVTVVEPDIIAGVSATVSGSDLKLSYDDVLISAGALNSDGLNPISALPCITETLENGWVTDVWRESVFETECICARMRVSDATCLTVWLDPELHAPLYAELDNDGVVVLSCTFDTWIRG